MTPRFTQLTAHGAQVQTRSHAGEAEDPFPAGPVDLDPGRQIAFTLQSREPVVITNFNEEERFEPPAFLPRNISSGMSCTVLGEGKHPWGVLAVYADSPRNYTSDDVAFLQAVANILAGSVQRSFTERRFQLAFAAAPNGMVMVNEEGIIQIVNAQMEQMFGYSADEMIGRHVEMLLPDRYRGKHPSLRTIFG